MTGKRKNHGAAFKAKVALAMLHWLGIMPCYSRPRICDDNPFVESLFRTGKYRPEFLATGFADLTVARLWARRFVHWYNHEHRCCAAYNVSPAQRHDGCDRESPQRSHAPYLQARKGNPQRWSGQTRVWSRIAVVALNPERDSLKTVLTHVYALPHVA